MKTVFNWLMAAAGGLLAAGCIDLEAEPLSESTASATGTTAATTGAGSTDDGTEDTGEDATGDDGCGDACGQPHGLSGELMLFVNARLSSAEALHTSNMPLAEEGTFLGPGLFLYDPLLDCEDGTNACRMVSLGQLDLDERLGPVSVGDGSLRKFTLRELAWSPTQGLWAVSFDTKNDEWGVAFLDVADYTVSDNRIGVDRYAILPGDAQSPSTDPCYWQESLSGLAFMGDELLLGVRGVGGLGIANNGGVFRVDLDVIEQQGYCVYDNDVSQDPHYYACDVLCRPWAWFEPQVGIGGDLEEHPDMQTLLALVRAEDEAIMPLDRRALYRIDPPPMGDLATPESLQTYADGVPQGLDIEGLARIEGRIFGIDVWGKVFEFDVDARVVREHDDLGPLFPDYTESLKIRGATRVVLE